MKNLPIKGKNTINKKDQDFTSTNEPIHILPTLDLGVGFRKNGEFVRHGQFSSKQCRDLEKDIS